MIKSREEYYNDMAEVAKKFDHVSFMTYDEYVIDAIQEQLNNDDTLIFRALKNLK